MQFNFGTIGVILGLVSLLGGALWWAIATFIENRHLKREKDDLRVKEAEQQDEITTLKRQLADTELTPEKRRLIARISELHDELRRARAEKDHIIALGDQLVVVYKDLQQRSQAALARLAGEKNAAQQAAEDVSGRNEEFSQHIQELEAQLDGLKAQDGRLWQRRVLPSAPSFRPRADRGFPIISVLNLKGGVGKTTITAHLAGALGHKGKRVLMVDLDYQRSLSMMLVPTEQRKLLHLERRCLQHFFACPKHGAAELLACTHLVAAMPNCSIVTNSDVRSATKADESLEETEARLMGEWTVQHDGTDIRMMLREGLHAPEMTRKFDYVLLDCPPRLTTACINALAASDFVLVPVVLDALSAKSVGNLLRSLRRLRESVLPDLNVLGVVANLVHLRQGSPIQQQDAVWEQLKLPDREQWGKNITFFKAVVPDNIQFANAAGSIDDGQLRLALEDARIQKCFNQLIAEIEKEMRNHECGHAAAVSS